MLQSLFQFILISAFCLAWGLPLYMYYGYKKKSLCFAIEETIFSFLIGLALLSIFSSWISLFFPVKFFLFLVLTVVLIAAEIIWLKKINWRIDFSFFKRLKLIDVSFLFLCLLLFTFLSTGKPTMEDTDLYHVQTIRWINEYGTVPGLANLYLRYGFYSNWFHLISIFYLPFKNQNFIYLNYTFTIWLFFFLFYQYKLFSKSDDKVSKHLMFFYFVIPLFMLVEWDLFRVACSSTSYDFIITSITLVSIHLLIKKIIFKSSSKEEESILILLLAIAPFFKLTGFLLAPLILVLLFHSTNKISTLLKTIIIGILCFIPYAYKNYLQTGYLFFPYQFADFFYPSWKVPEEMVSRFNDYIYFGNHYINQDIPKRAWTNNWTFSYYKDWFLHLVKADQIFIMVSLISLPLSFLTLKKIYNQQFNNILILLLACIIPLFIWLVTSPDLRFAFGLLIFIAFFPLTALFTPYIKQWTYTAFTAIFIFGIGYYIYKKGDNSFNFKNLVAVKPVDIPPYTPISIHNQVYYIPRNINNNWNSRCIDCPIPCIYHSNPYLQLLGKKIINGFKMNPYPDSVFIQNYRY